MDDSVSVSSDSVGHGYLGTATHDHLGRPVQQMLPDNQLGMPPSDHSDDSDISPSKADHVDTERPEPEPESPNSEEPTPPTEEERLKSFWKKFVVPRPKPTSKPDESEEDDGDRSSNSMSVSKPGSPSFSDHRDSDTLNLSDVGRDCEGSVSGSESDLSLGSVVDEGDFHKAMEVGGISSHSAAVTGISSMSTMETPRCSKPDPRMHTTNSNFSTRYTGDFVQDH